MGLSHSSSAGLVAGFNLSSAVGRIAFGQLADWIGPINALMLAFAINAISLLLVWPLSGTLPPLIVFVVMTGVAAGEFQTTSSTRSDWRLIYGLWVGAFFSLMPTVVASISDPATLPSAMGMTVTGWAAGYLLGAPIAGYLLGRSPIVFHAG
jgi:predicted MFS family arabinose efflux permease